MDWISRPHFSAAERWGFYLDTLWKEKGEFMNNSGELPLVNVTAAILSRGKQVLIAKRKATGSLPHKWEFPGGKVESGKTPQQCMNREMEAATG